jgi:hypothetical protein
MIGDEKYRSALEMNFLMLDWSRVNMPILYICDFLDVLAWLLMWSDESQIGDAGQNVRRSWRWQKSSRSTNAFNEFQIDVCKKLSDSASCAVKIPDYIFRGLGII